MDTCASTVLQRGRTRFLLVDTDNLFLGDIGSALLANETIDVVGTVRSIEDAYECAARHTPDVIVIGWGRAARPFVHTALANQSGAPYKQLIVIVLPKGVSSIPGLTSLSLLPNVALVVHEQVEKWLFRQCLPKFPALLQ